MLLLLQELELQEPGLVLQVLAQLVQQEPVQVQQARGATGAVGRYPLLLLL